MDNEDTGRHTLAESGLTGVARTRAARGYTALAIGDPRHEPSCVPLAHRKMALVGHAGAGSATVLRDRIRRARQRRRVRSPPRDRAPPWAPTSGSLESDAVFHEKVQAPRSHTCAAVRTRTGAAAHETGPNQ